MARAIAVAQMLWHAKPPSVGLGQQQPIPRLLRCLPAFTWHGQHYLWIVPGEGRSEHIPDVGGSRKPTFLFGQARPVVGAGRQRS